MRKRVLSLLLCTALLLGMFPASAVVPEAAGSSQTTTSATPDGKPAVSGTVSGSVHSIAPGGGAAKPMALSGDVETHEDDPAGIENAVDIRVSETSETIHWDKYSSPEGLPAGVTFDTATNTLTLNNAQLASLVFRNWADTHITLNVQGINTISSDGIEFRVLHFYACHDVTITGGGTLQVIKTSDGGVNIGETMHENFNMGDAALTFDDFFTTSDYGINEDTSLYHINPNGTLNISGVTLDVSNRSIYGHYQRANAGELVDYAAFFADDAAPIRLQVGSVQLTGADIQATGAGMVHISGANVSIDSSSTVTASGLHACGFGDYRTAEGSRRTLTVDGALNLTGVPGDSIAATKDAMAAALQTTLDKVYVNATSLVLDAGIDMVVDGGAVSVSNNGVRHDTGISTSGTYEDGNVYSWIQPASIQLKSGSISVSGAYRHGIDNFGGVIAQTGGTLSVRNTGESALWMYGPDGRNEPKNVVLPVSTTLSGGTAEFLTTIPTQPEGDISAIYADGTQPSLTISGSAQVTAKVSGSCTGESVFGLQNVFGLHMIDATEGNPGAVPILTVSGSPVLTVDLSGLTGAAPNEGTTISIQSGTVDLNGGTLHLTEPKNVDVTAGILARDAALTIGDADITVDSPAGMTAEVFTGIRLEGSGKSASAKLAISGGTFHIAPQGTSRVNIGIGVFRDGTTGDGLSITGGTFDIDFSHCTGDLPNNDHQGISFYAPVSITGGTMEIHLPAGKDYNPKGITGSGPLTIGGTASITIDHAGAESCYVDSINVSAIDDAAVNMESSFTLKDSASVSITAPTGSWGGQLFHVDNCQANIQGGTLHLTIPENSSTDRLTAVLVSAPANSGNASFNMTGGELVLDLHQKQGNGDLIGLMLERQSSATFSGGNVTINITDTSPAGNPESRWLTAMDVSERSTLTVQDGASITCNVDSCGNWNYFVKAQDKYTRFNQTGGTMQMRSTNQVIDTRTAIGLQLSSGSEGQLSGGTFSVQGKAFAGLVVEDGSALTINGSAAVDLDLRDVGVSFVGVVVSNASTMTLNSSSAKLDIDMPASPPPLDDGTVPTNYGMIVELDSMVTLTNGALNINQKTASGKSDARVGFYVSSNSVLAFRGGTTKVSAALPLEYYGLYGSPINFADGINPNVVEADGSADRMVETETEDYEEEGEIWEHGLWTDPGKTGEITVLVKQQSSAQAAYEGSLELVNAGAVTAGLEYQAKYTATLTKPTGTITFTLSPGMALVSGSVTVNNVPQKSITASGNTFSVPINSGDIVRFTVLPGAGENTITSSTGRTGEEETVTFSAAAYTFSVPTDTRKPVIPLSGTAAVGAKVQILVNGTVAAEAEVSKAGNWKTTITVQEGENEVIAIVIPSEGASIRSDPQTVIYTPDSIAVETLKFTNWIHGRTELDPPVPVTSIIYFQDAAANAERSRYYIYWPELPEFEFEVKFCDDAGTPDKVKDVMVVATDWKGTEQRVYLSYNSDTHTWVGTHLFCDDNNIVPDLFRVEWRNIDEPSDSGTIPAEAPGLKAEDYGELDYSDVEDPDSPVNSNYDNTDMDFTWTDATQYTVTLASGVKASSISVTTLVGSDATTTTGTADGLEAITITAQPGTTVLLSGPKDGTFTGFEKSKLSVTFSGGGNVIKFNTENVTVDNNAKVDGSGNVTLSSQQTLKKYLVIGSKIYKIDNGKATDISDMTDPSYVPVDPDEIYEEVIIRDFSQVDWSQVKISEEEKAAVAAAFKDSPMMARIMSAVEGTFEKEGSFEVKGVEVNYEISVSAGHDTTDGKNQISLGLEPTFEVTVEGSTKLRGVEYDVEVSVFLTIDLNADTNINFQYKSGSGNGDITLSTEGEVEFGVTATISKDNENDPDTQKYFEEKTKEQILEKLSAKGVEDCGIPLCCFYFPVPVAPLLAGKLRTEVFCDWSISGEFGESFKVALPPVTASVLFQDNEVAGSSITLGKAGDVTGHLHLHVDGDICVGLKTNFGLTFCDAVYFSSYVKVGPYLAIRGHLDTDISPSQTATTLEGAMEVGLRISPGVEMFYFPNNSYPVDLAKYSIKLWEGGRKVMPHSFTTIQSDKEGPIIVTESCDLKNVIDLYINNQKLFGNLEDEEEILDLEKYSFLLVSQNVPVRLTQDGQLTITDTREAFEFDVKVLYTVRNNYEIWKIETLKFSPTTVTIIKTTEGGGPRDATFQVIDSASKNGKKYSTGPDGMVVFDAIPGHTYIITEVDWPDGYHPVTTTNTITAGDEPQTVNFTNVKDKEPEEDDTPELPVHRTQNEPMGGEGDPSGYVFEGIPSNRLAGVTTQIYYSKTGDDSDAVLWPEAALYDQKATLETDLLGQYLWMVPGGYWQVRYHMDGYEDARSEWMVVPPIRTGVNQALVRKSPATLMEVTYDEDLQALIIRFDRPVQVSSVRKDLILSALEGIKVTGSFRPVDADWSVIAENSDGVESTWCATTFVVQLTATNEATKEPYDLDGVSVTVDASKVETYYNVKPTATSDSMKKSVIVKTNTPKPAAATRHVTVINGSVSKANATPGETVIIYADPANAGERFTGWTVEPAGILTLPAEETVSFIMPDADITITANYEKIPSSWTGPSTSEPDVSPEPTPTPTPSTEPTTPSDKVTAPVEIEAPTHGTISLSKSIVAAGDKVTITVKADEGYEVDQITVLDADGKPVTVTKNADGTWSFTAPAKLPVSIKVSFKHVCPSEAYTDLDVTAWYHDSVDYVLLHKLMVGTSETTFEPLLTINRAMLATILYNMEGRPAVSAPSTFTDVAANTYYTDSVAWAQANKVVAGIGADTFAPNDTLTREQMATMLYNYAVYKGYDVTVPEDTTLDRFSDAASVSSWAKTALLWATSKGLISGTSTDPSVAVLNPSGSSSRAEMAALIRNFMLQVEAAKEAKKDA